MTLAEALARLPENLQEEVQNLQNSHGESVALSYARLILSPEYPTIDRRKLPK